MHRLPHATEKEKITAPDNIRIIPGTAWNYCVPRADRQLKPNTQKNTRRGSYKSSLSSLLISIPVPKSGIWN